VRCNGEGKFSLHELIFCALFYIIIYQPSLHKVAALYGVITIPATPRSGPWIATSMNGDTICRMV